MLESPTPTLSNTGEGENASIHFLTIEQGATAILDETYEPYFSILQSRETHALTGEKPPNTSIEDVRTFARKTFSSAVTSFSDKEKNAIQYVTSVIKEKLLEQELDIIANHTWNFIKIEDWLCGGFAHTRGDYIILSQRHLDHLTSNWSNNMTSKDSILVIEKLSGLLVHEQFHSIQRKYPEKFESLYSNSWHFEKVNVALDSFTIINQLTNPDAPKPEWMFPIQGNHYWIRTLINPDIEKPEMGKDFMDVVFTLEKNKNKFTIKYDSLNHPIKTNLSSLDSYTKLFPTSQGLDHPNEITAYMFSDYFISVLQQEKPFENVSSRAKDYSEKYVSWLKESFNSSN
jgi:hypothetical protein